MRVNSNLFPKTFRRSLGKRISYRAKVDLSGIALDDNELVFMVALPISEI